MRLKEPLALGLALLVLGAFVGLVGWQEVLGAATGARLGVYSLAFVAMGCCLIARSLVWQLVLTVVDQRRPYWLIGSVFLTAMLAKYITPYGQVTSGVGMAAVVSRYYESAYEESLAGIVSSDFLNYIPYYTFGGVGVGYLLVVASPGIDLREYALPVTGLVVAILLGLLILWWRRDLVETIVVSLTGALRALVSHVSERQAARLRRENVRDRLEGFYLTLDFLSQDRRTMVKATFLAHLGWLGMASALFFSALAVGTPIPMGLVLLCLAISKFGFLVPTPGGVGGVEITLAAVIYLVVPTSFATATAIAILFRFATYWFTILLGGISSVALTLSDPTPP